MNTIGIVLVACCAAKAPRSPTVTKASNLSAANSAARGSNYRSCSLLSCEIRVLHLIYHCGGGPNMSTEFDPVKANEFDIA